MILFGHSAAPSGKKDATPSRHPMMSSDKKAETLSGKKDVTSRHPFMPSGRDYLKEYEDASSADVPKAQRTQKSSYIVYTKTDDMLYSGGNGSGLSYYIKYAPDSTEEDPTVIAKGVDENGKEFEQTIHINKINPQCATLVEMHALEGYLGVEKQGGFTSLPFAPSMGSMGLHDRGNFIHMFRNTISDMNLLKQKQAAAYYEYSMQAYLDFMYHKF